MRHVFFLFFCYFVVVVVGKEGAGARELLLILWFANIVVIVVFAAAMIDGANCCGCFFGIFLDTLPSTRATNHCQATTILSIEKIKTEQNKTWNIIV